MLNNLYVEMGHILVHIVMSMILEDLIVESGFLLLNVFNWVSG